MKKQLVNLANHLDRIGNTKEASYIDNLLKKAQDEESEIMLKKPQDTYYVLIMPFDHAGEFEWGIFSTFEKAEDAKRKITEQAIRSDDSVYLTEHLMIKERKLIIDPIISDDAWEDFLF